MKILFLLLLLGGVGGARSAWADLDQMCLKQCIGNGAVADTCMTRCSYGQPAPTPSHSILSPHRVVDTPVVSDDVIMIAPKPAAPPPDKDYVCLNKCVGAGQVYARCEQNCAKPDCGTDMITCHNPTMTVSGGQISGQVMGASVGR